MLGPLPGALSAAVPPRRGFKGRGNGVPFVRSGETPAFTKIKAWCVHVWWKSSEAVCMGRNSHKMRVNQETCPGLVRNCHE